MADRRDPADGEAGEVVGLPRRRTPDPRLTDDGRQACHVDPVGAGDEAQDGLGRRRRGGRRRPATSRSGRAPRRARAPRPRRCGSWPRGRRRGARRPCGPRPRRRAGWRDQGLGHDRSGTAGSLASAAAVPCPATPLPRRARGSDAAHVPALRPAPGRAGRRCGRARGRLRLGRHPRRHAAAHVRGHRRGRGRLRAAPDVGGLLPAVDPRLAPVVPPRRPPPSSSRRPAVAGGPSTGAATRRGCCPGPPRPSTGSGTPAIPGPRDRRASRQRRAASSGATASRASCRCASTATTSPRPSRARRRCCARSGSSAWARRPPRPPTSATPSTTCGWRARRGPGRRDRVGAGRRGVAAAAGAADEPAVAVGRPPGWTGSGPPGVDSATPAGGRSPVKSGTGERRSGAESAGSTADPRNLIRVMPAKGVQRDASVPTSGGVSIPAIRPAPAPRHLVGDGDVPTARGARRGVAGLGRRTPASSSAADGGATKALAAGLRPDLVVGDADSLGPEGPGGRPGGGDPAGARPGGQGRVRHWSSPCCAGLAPRRDPTSPSSVRWAVPGSTTRWPMSGSWPTRRSRGAAARPPRWADPRPAPRCRGGARLGHPRRAGRRPRLALPVRRRCGRRRHRRARLPPPRRAAPGGSGARAVQRPDRDRRRASPSGPAGC